MAHGGRRKNAGRKPGSVSIKRETRAQLFQLVKDQLVEAPNLFGQITDPAEKLNVLVKFLPFVCPKLEVEKDENQETEQLSASDIAKEFFKILEETKASEQDSNHIH